MREGAPSQVRRKLGGTAAWTLIDQALSSLTNVALSIVVARAVSPTEFGGFSVALIAFTFAVGLLRAIVCEPYVITINTMTERRQRVAKSDATGSALSVGAVGSLLCLAAAPLLSDEAKWSLIGLAVMLPGILLQDTVRFIFFAARRPQLAALLDGIWAVGQLATVGFLLWAGTESLFLLVLAWGASATVAGLVGLVITRTRPRPGRVVSWWRRQHALSSKFAVDYLVQMGLVNLTYFVVGWMLGLRALGAIRGAQVLLGPLQLLSSGITAFALPLFSRMASRGRPVLRPALVVGAGTGLIAVGWSLILLLLPDQLGAALLGETWANAAGVLLPMCALYVAIALGIGGLIGLKSMAHSGTVLGVTLVYAPLFLALGALGSATFGVAGGASGMAIAQTAGTVLTWWGLAHRDRRRHSTRVATAA